MEVYFLVKDTSQGWRVSPEHFSELFKNALCPTGKAEGSLKCPGRDSNPHGPEGHVILSHVRLPIPPPGQICRSEPSCQSFGFGGRTFFCAAFSERVILHDSGGSSGVQLQVKPSLLRR